MQSERLRWMDFVRGVCILLVVTMHASSALMERADIASPQAVQIFNAALDPFRMTLLMFLSGMLLGKSLGKATGPYVTGKLAQIYWPFLIWSMVILFAEDRLTLEYILKTPFSAPTLLWYLWFLFAYYIMTFGMMRFRIPVVPTIMLFLVLAEFLPSVLRAPRFAYLFVFFLLGHYYVENASRIRISWPVAVAGLALAAVGAYLSTQGMRIKYESLHIWAPLGLILGIIWVSRYYGSGNPFSVSIEWVGRNSIVFYVVHFPVQCAVVAVMTSIGYRDFLAIYPLAILFSLLAASALQVLRQRHLLVAGLFDFRKLQAFLFSQTSRSSP